MAICKTIKGQKCGVEETERILQLFLSIIIGAFYKVHFREKNLTENSRVKKRCKNSK
jgi:hypothetical protein